jgi:hypothetical protein
MDEIREYIFIAAVVIGILVVLALATGKKGDSTNDSTAVSVSKDDKLDKIYDVLNHIRWIGLSIGGMFAVTFMLPQCTGG